MKKLLVIAAASILFMAFAVIDGTWKNDPPHSQLYFTIGHLGVADVTGDFTDFSVTIRSTKPDFSDATFDLTANTASIDTRVEERNNHLKSADFFDVKTFPTLSFKSTHIHKVGNNKYQLTGDLTMHGVTKSVTLDLLYRGSTVNPMTKKQTVGFQVTGTIRRTEFGIGTKFPPPMLSDEVQIKADGEFVQNENQNQ